MTRDNTKPSQPPTQPVPRATGHSRSDIRAVIALLAVCLALGLVGTRWGLADAGHEHYSFHADETPGIRCSVSILTSDEPLFPTAWAYEQSPFFFYVSAALFKVASVLRIVTVRPEPTIPEYTRLLLVGRLLVVLLYGGTVLLVFYAVKRMWDQSTARFAALLTALSPALVTNAHYFKNDVPLALAALVTLIVAQRILDVGRARDYVWAGILCGLATATKVQWCSSRGSGSYSAFSAPDATSRATAATQASPVGPRRLCGRTRSRGPRPAPAPGRRHTGGLARARARRAGDKTFFMLVARRDNASFISVLGYGLGIVPLLAGLSSMVYLVSKERDTGLLLILPFTLFFFLMLLAFEAAYVRYLVPFAPFLMMPIARAAFLLGRRNGLRRILAIAAGSLVALYSLLNSVAYLTPMAGIDARTRAADWLAEHAPTQSRVTFETSTSEGYSYADAAQYRLQEVFETREGDNRDTALLSHTDYFVASEAVDRKYLRQLADLPLERLFYERLMNSPEFRLVADFDSRPELFGLKFSKGFPPTDLMYFSAPHHYLPENHAGALSLSIRLLLQHHKLGPPVLRHPLLGIIRDNRARIGIAPGKQATGINLKLVNQVLADRLGSGFG